MPPPSTNPSRARPLQMSLSAAQVFVRTDDDAAVEEVVAAALYEWALGVGELPIREDGSTTPLDRHIVLLPPVDGWVTLIENEGRVDRSIARNIHARTCALTIASSAGRSPTSPGSTASSRLPMACCRAWIKASSCCQAVTTAARSAVTRL